MNATTVRSIGRAGGQLLLRRSAAPGGVVFAYHDVVERPTRESLAVTPRQLEGHLRTARRLGLTFVPLVELVARLLRGGPVDGLAAVVFDDALLGVHRQALPVLAEAAVPSTLCPVSRALGVDPPWWPGSQRTLTRSELQELISGGMTVAGHTRTHPSLPTLNDRQLADELSGARADLADLTGTAVELVAYPYGHHDRRVRVATAEAGYRAGFTFLNGRLTGREDLLRLPRLTMWPGMSSARLAYALCRPAESWPDHQRDIVLHEPE